MIEKLYDVDFKQVQVWRNPDNGNIDMLIHTNNVDDRVNPIVDLRLSVPQAKALLKAMKGVLDLGYASNTVNI